MVDRLFDQPFVFILSKNFPEIGLFTNRFR